MSGILCVRDTSGAPYDQEPFLAALRLLSPRGSAGESVRALPGLRLGVRSSEPWPSPAAASAGSTLAPGGALRDPLAAGADGRVLVAVDGRIDSGAGPSAGSGPGAAETVLRAFLEHGEGCFARLLGVFGIVVWDGREERVWLARDPMGVRPLYYATEGSRFLAGSEIKSLLRLEPSLRETNRARVRAMVRNTEVDDWSDTAFARIRPVVPGTTLLWDSRGASVQRYWALRPDADPGLDVGTVRGRLAEVIARATPVDVPVGLSLSGGIDSSAIAGFVSNPADGVARDVRAFSVRPPETADESFLIEATVRRTGLPHVYASLEAVDPARALDRLIDAHDEPVLHSGGFYQFLLRQAMAEAGCRAVLVGYGADEIFGGYRYLATPFLVSLAASGRWVDALRFSRGAVGLLGTSSSRTFRDAARWSAGRLRARITRAIKVGLGHNPAQALRSTHGRSVLAREKASPSRAGASGAGMAVSPWCEVDRVWGGRVFFRALTTCLRKNISLLVRVEDRNAAAFGLELCAPFMERDLVDMAYRIPFPRFMEGGRNKAVLRDAAAPFLAPEVASFPKKLPTPGNDGHLAFGALAPELRDLLASRSFRESGLWSDRCAALYEEDASARRRGSLWFRVYMVSRWYDRVACPKGFEPSTFSFGG